MRSLLLALLLAGPALAQDRPAHTVALNGIAMAYRDVGAGDPLVLLHGFGDCAEGAWAPFVDTLAAHYRLILPDLRGHGHSTNPSDQFTHRLSAADVLALLDALGLGRVRAMGISAGGMTLLHAAQTAPERFEKLVVVGVGTSLPNETRGWMRETTLETLPPPVAAGFRACAARGEAQAAALAAQFARLADDPRPGAFAPLDLSAVTAPTLLVQGDRDVFFPAEQVVGVYRQLSEAELWVVPGGDHVPIYRASVPFTTTALRFLKEERR